MKRVVQEVDLSADKVQLYACSVFYTTDISGIVYADHWSTDPDGTQRFYNSQDVVRMLSSMSLWARYPGGKRTVTYYSVNGSHWSRQIQDYFTLDDSPEPNFVGWMIDNEICSRPFKRTKVKKDYIALMSCYGTCTLSYDSNGGTGSMPSYSTDCATFVDDSLHVQSNAEDVPLKSCAFSKSFIAPDDHLPYPFSFYNWRVDNVEMQPGNNVQLKQDLTAVAQWRYPTLYDIDVRCDPVVAATVSSIGQGSTIQQRRMSNIKTLSAYDLRYGFTFDGWYSSAGVRVSSNALSCKVNMQQKSDSFQFNVSKASYIAKFSYDKAYTIVVDTNDKMATKKVDGMLKRSDVLGMTAFTAHQKLFTEQQQDEEQFAEVRAIR